MITPQVQDDPAYSAQAVLDATDLAAVAAGSDSTGTLSGCSVTAQTGELGVSIAAGTVVIGGTQVTVEATNLAISGPSVGDRRDIVVAESDGVSVVVGEPCPVPGWSSVSGVVAPVKPDLPSGSVLLAEVYVPGGTTSEITSDMVTDKRCVLSSSSWVPTSSLGADDGVATLDGTGNVPEDQLGNVPAAQSIVHNVQDYGADPTGNTNPAVAAATTTAIQAADTAAAASGGMGIVYFPPGTYVTNATLRPSAGNTWLGTKGRSILVPIPSGGTWTSYGTDGSTVSPTTLDSPGTVFCAVLGDHTHLEALTFQGGVNNTTSYADNPAIDSALGFVAPTTAFEQGQQQSVMRDLEFVAWNGWAIKSYRVHITEGWWSPRFVSFFNMFGAGNAGGFFWKGSPSNTSQDTVAISVHKMDLEYCEVDPVCTIWQCHDVHIWDLWGTSNGTDSFLKCIGDSKDVRVYGAAGGGANVASLTVDEALNDDGSTEGLPTNNFFEGMWVSAYDGADLNQGNNNTIKGVVSNNSNFGVRLNGGTAWRIECTFNNPGAVNDIRVNSSLATAMFVCPVSVSGSTGAELSDAFWSIQKATNGMTVVGMSDFTVSANTAPYGSSGRAPNKIYGYP